MFRSLVPRARRALGLVLAAACIATGCSSGTTSYAVAPFVTKGSASPSPHASQTTTGASGAPSATPTTTMQATTQTMFPSKLLGGTVALPSGSTTSLSTLSVINSIGTATVGSNGAFSLQTYTDGPQLTTVLDKNGNPVLLGWLSPGSTTIDVNSTAAVLLFYASDSFALTADLRAEMLSLIPAAPGIGTLASAIAGAIVANPDSFATSNAVVTGALQSLVTSLIAGPAKGSVRGGRIHAILAGAPSLIALRKRMGVRIIAANTPTSGLTPIIDFPDGIHFLNELRRPADVFIDRVSYVDSSGTTQPDPGSLTPNGPLNVPATSGVQGGTISTLVDIINGTYAYSPITTDSALLPLVMNARSTLYQVTAVGPGLFDGSFSQIPAAYQTDGNTLSLTFMVTDFLLPLIVSQVLPSADVDSALEMPGLEDAISDLIGTLSSLPDIVDASSSGDIGTALSLAFNAVATSGTFSNAAIDTLLTDLLSTESSTVIEESVGKAEAFFGTVGVADRVEQAFDASVVYKELNSSNRADVYLVTVTPDKVTLSPPNQTIAAGFDGYLDAAVPDAGSSGTAFAYTYTNTAQFGHLFDGMPGHEDNFSSSSASVTYVANANVGKGGTDTVSVTVAAIDGSSRDAVGNAASANVTVVPTPSPTPAMLSVSISPTGCSSLGNGGGITYTASASNVPMGTTLQYAWQLGTGTAPSTLTFSDPGATYEQGPAAFVGPSNVVNITTKPISGGGYSNLSISVQAQALSSSGTIVANSVAAVAFFSYGQLSCPQ